MNEAPYGLEDGNGTAQAAVQPPVRRPNPDAIQAQLERILASPRFVTSPRCQLMLRFLVEKSLGGNSDLLKERTIGIEILNRDPAYDTNADPAVRMTASEIRKKLAQYYYDQGNQDQIRIELPIGSYSPLFSLPERTSENPPPSNAVAFTPPSAQALHPELNSAAQTSQRSRPRTNGIRVAAVVACALAICAGTVYWRAVNAPAPVDQFWAPILKSSNPLLIYPDQLRATSVEVAPVGSRTPSGWVEPAEPRAIAPQGIPVLVLGDAVTMANIVGTFHAEKKQFSSRGVTATSYSDLQRGADVLFGGFNNNWTIYLTRSMPYRLMNNAEGLYWIEDQKNPNAKIGMERLNDQANAPQEFGLVARVFVAETNQPAIIIAGIGPSGTVAAGEFATNSQYIAEFMKTAPRNWQTKNLEILVSANVVDNQPGPPHVVASVVW